MRALHGIVWNDWVDYSSNALIQWFSILFALNIKIKICIFIFHTLHCHHLIFEGLSVASILPSIFGKSLPSGAVALGVIIQLFPSESSQAWPQDIEESASRSPPMVNVDLRISGWSSNRIHTGGWLIQIHVLQCPGFCLGLPTAKGEETLGWAPSSWCDEEKPTLMRGIHSLCPNA